MRIAHIITGLGQGGAESVLYRLTTYVETTTRHLVISLTDDGVYGARLRAAGVPVYTLGMARGRVTLRGFLALRALLLKEAPNAVQTWMYHADLIGGLAARLAGIRAIAWGVRNSGNHLGRSSRSARWVLRLCALLSAIVPRAIVCAARDAAWRHERLGYQREKILVIPNGYDFSRYQPDVEAGRRMRAVWGVSRETLLVGCVARWDPLKDHGNLLRALHLLLRSCADSTLQCVLIGRGMTIGNADLAALIEGEDLRGRVLLVGPTDDVPAVMNSLDVHVLSSCAEGFPNVVAEAMACGTPCVVTDVGDAAHIVGDSSRVAPAQQPAELARVLEMVLHEVSTRGREAVGATGRARVLSHFGLAHMVRSYETVWRRIAGGRRES